MGSIQIDKSKYSRTHKDDLDTCHQALWTFSIQERDVCFWGRYNDAETTAMRYAHCHGLDSGTITLVDCTASLRGLTKH